MDLITKCIIKEDVKEIKKKEVKKLKGRAMGLLSNNLLEMFIPKETAMLD